MHMTSYGAVLALHILMVLLSVMIAAVLHTARCTSRTCGRATCWSASTASGTARLCPA